jgi:hypothetical protein
MIKWSAHQKDVRIVNMCIQQWSTSVHKANIKGSKEGRLQHKTIPLSITVWTAHSDRKLKELWPKTTLYIKWTSQTYTEYSLQQQMNKQPSQMHTLQNRPYGRPQDTSWQV